MQRAKSGHHINIGEPGLNFCCVRLESASILFHLNDFYLFSFFSQLAAKTKVTSTILTFFFIKNPMLEPKLLCKENGLCCAQNKNVSYLCKIVCVSVIGNERFLLDFVNIFYFLFQFYTWSIFVAARPAAPTRIATIFAGHWSQQFLPSMHLIYLMSLNFC